MTAVNISVGCWENLTHAVFFFPCFMATESAQPVMDLPLGCGPCPFDTPDAAP